MGRAERFRGFRDGASDMHGARVDDIVFDEAIGFRPAFIEYVRSQGAPTALFCAHDGIAISVMSELMRLGVRVPEDISVVGFNDFASAKHISPRLTTVRTPQSEIGAAMVRCISDRLSGSEAAKRPPVRLAMMAEIVKRESTGPTGDAERVKRLVSKI